ncbi:hypothetical protein PRIPAC_89788 [Pristionchus pacificus]|uniref:Uncharacterized protein n=1 Tax=Pristionchus pacificus TaxID=54126 RepID=A0A2A6B7B6_PRIPA|nr:hypothetical protein PRIPAC_89788 [Pristionchus pacificus]|eukprot:PDM61761.1 hypothetical protein PRIPAC_51203 [Pristionchus pacificus]
MNSEQIQDYLTELSEQLIREKPSSRNEEIEDTRKLLTKTEEKTRYILFHIKHNYIDVDLVQPIVAQILALYYRAGAFRQYALQYIPTFIELYLVASSKKQYKSVSVFETFFLAIYNEEILEPTPSNAYAKKIEEVRIPSIRFPSIYHDPSKLNTVPEITTLKTGNSPTVHSTVRLGPYPTMERLTAENKFLILSRIMRSVNSSLAFLSSDVVGSSISHASIVICLSGFSVPESDLRVNILPSNTPSQIIEDLSKKARIMVSSQLLVELVSGVYLALYNGSADIALRALDALHQRAQYEFLPHILLDKTKRRELVTNASLRMKRLPDDIPVMEVKEKEHSALDEFVEGVDHMKKKLQSHAHRLKHHRRKSNSTDEEIELQPIREDSVIEESTTNDRLEKSERGAFVREGIRHADSISSSARSVDC